MASWIEVDDNGDEREVCDQADYDALAARLAEAERRAGEMERRYDRLTVDYGKRCDRLAEAERDAAKWRAVCTMSRQIQDRELRGIVTSFLDALAYGESKFDMQAEVNKAASATHSADGVKP